MYLGTITNPPGMIDELGTIAHRSGLLLARMA